MVGCQTVFQRRDIFSSFDDIFNFNFVHIKLLKPYIDGGFFHDKEIISSKNMKANEKAFSEM